MALQQVKFLNGQSKALIAVRDMNWGKIVLDEERSTENEEGDYDGTVRYFTLHFTR